MSWGPAPAGTAFEDGVGYLGADHKTEGIIPSNAWLYGESTDVRTPLLSPRRLR